MKKTTSSQSTTTTIKLSQKKLHWTLSDWFEKKKSFKYQKLIYVSKINIL
jgi:hypothetical protein